MTSRMKKKLLYSGLVLALWGGQAMADDPYDDWGLDTPLRTARLIEDDTAGSDILSNDDEASLKDRVAKLEALLADKSEDDGEDPVEELSGTVDDLSDSFKKFSGDKSIVHSGSSKSTMKVSGRVHVDGWGFADSDDNISIFNGGGDVDDALDPQNRLGFRRLRFGVKGDIKDNMIYKIEMEFAGGNDSEFRDAYLGWEELPFLQTLLIGNQKRPYGLDHLNSSRFNVFIERPFVIESFNQDARRLGIASYGYDDAQLFNWRYGVYNQRNVQSLGNYIDDHLQLELTGRLASTPWYDEVSGGRGYAHFAISGTVADTDPDAINGNEARFRSRPEARSSGRWIDTGRIASADAFQMMGVEAVINLGALQLVGEYQTMNVDRIDGFSDANLDGGYVYASYFLTGEHMPWDRKSGTLARITPFQNFWSVRRCDGGVERGWGAWQVAVRYSTADFNDGVINDGVFGGQGDAWTFGLNWYWNPNARMQFNYINGQIANRIVSDPADPPAPAGPLDNTLQTGDYSIYGVRFMVDF
ncbi:OprO/OprP family phosphate-selective porin [Roseimaritima ulvae]|uniref:Phosphate-selective porin O and P n=2 Tax=Roseimaritima ulvae TaxID=980254 RepID=A0A5B9QYF9_9BACT|nr:porin [Roseimaritima ulvae]QEG43062.1 Phosphate-selective porin O and P [Roseimaritima ulvae]